MADLRRARPFCGNGGRLRISRLKCCGNVAMCKNQGLQGMIKERKMPDIKQRGEQIW
jgi:hypothetical protein